MPDHLAQVRVAVVQAASVLFEREASLEKACQLTAEAAAQGAQVILFPEAFIPGYPRGLTFGTVVGSRTAAGRRTWERYWANSMEVPGPQVDALGEAARRAQAYLAIGVIERDSQFSGGTLYCTLLYFGPDGGRAPDLGGGRRQHVGSRADRIWGDGRADLLGELYAAGAHGHVRAGS
jgi:nitrilase